MLLYHLLGRLFPTREAPANPKNIVLIRPCCIGDAVLATAALKALRRAYPAATITWAVGGWSRQAVMGHPAADHLLDTGQVANPARGLRGMWRFARRLRGEQFDMAVVLVRSPWMSIALLLSGIPHRVGLDSAGRGFGYTVRVPVDPAASRHEAEIYLDVLRALGADTSDCYANMPINPVAADAVRDKLAALGITGNYIAINPAGGRNPGGLMDVKRWPPQNFAQVINTLKAQHQFTPVLLAGPDDGDIIEAVQAHLHQREIAFIGELSFAEIAALAAGARLYIGNDTGLTHLAAAAGAHTVMLLGPSDPARYAPFSVDSLALWKPVELRAGGVSAGVDASWDWSRDGISTADALKQIEAYLQQLA